ncbi:MAG: dephospho-CoA kinase [Muribaculaceae bacterium]|nr:dephospho-CoA kinase [Muribaculaceae bacterium]
MEKIHAIGITGGIGAGKSVVSRILRLNGFTVFDCDSEARLLMENDSRLRNDLTSLLGEGAYYGKNLDRAYVSSRIFGDSRLREEVNRLVHHAIRNAVREAIAGTEDVLFVESAILSTGGLVPIVDEVWVVDAPEALRLERVMKRSAMDADSVRKRMESQERELSSITEREVRIILNDGDTPVVPQIGNLLERFMEGVLQEEGSFEYNDNKLNQEIC